MLKQNFPSQTCREWFIKLCAWGPDFAARNEYPAIESTIHIHVSNNMNIWIWMPVPEWYTYLWHPFLFKFNSINATVYWINQIWEHFQLHQVSAKSPEHARCGAINRYLSITRVLPRHRAPLAATPSILRPQWSQRPAGPGNSATSQRWRRWYGPHCNI